MASSMKAASSHRRVELVSLAAALILAAIIRLAWLPRSLWYDEIASLKFTEQAYPTLWSDWMRRETNPPLYYTLLKAWSGMFGTSDVALRGLSVAIGLAGLVAAWALARSIGGRRAGLWAALLVALTPQHVHFSQEVRSYGLTYAAALVALLGATVFMTKIDCPTRRRLGLLLYAGATSVALYAHTTMVLLPLIVNVSMLAWVATRRPQPPTIVIDWVVANVMVLLAWSWWLTITWWQIGHASNASWLTRPSPTLAARYVFDIYIPDSIAPIRLLVGMLLVGLASWNARTYCRGPAALLASAAIATPLLLYLLSLAVPVMLPRTVFWASGPFTVLIALGLARLRPALALCAGAVVCTALLAGTYLATRQATPEPWRTLVEIVRGADPDAWVVAGDPGVVFALQHYCPRPSCRLTLFTVPSPSETWSAGMPRPHQFPLAAFGPLAARHPLYSATRLARGDLTTVAAPVARARTLAFAQGSPGALALVEWTPASRQVPPHGR